MYSPTNKAFKSDNIVFLRESTPLTLIRQAANTLIKQPQPNNIFTPLREFYDYSPPYSEKTKE